MSFRKMTKRDSSLSPETLVVYERFEPRNLLASISLSDSSFLLNEIAANQSTAYLQQSTNALDLVTSRSEVGKTTALFQQSIAGIPVHNAYITTVQNGNGAVATFDRGLKGFEVTGPVRASISADAAINLATAEMSQMPENVGELSWLRAGDQARLTWKISSFTAQDAAPDVVTFVDAHSGVILEQQESPRDEARYVLDNPETITGVYPRIVINDAIGGSGSRSYAAPFDSVVSISVGCTGTLIAPNVVLSARHCGIGSGAQIFFGDDDNSPAFTATVASASQPDGNGTLLDGGDVSILTLTQAVPSSVATPMRLSTGTSDLVGEVAVTVGYGWNGVGSTGHGGTADGFRWGGENIIDAYGAPAAQSGTNIFSTDFDNGTSGANTIGSSSSTPLTFEATTAPGDSGGPLLVQVGSEWLIAGVLSGGTTNTSVYGDISWWTGIAPFQAEIEAAGGQFAGSGIGSVSFDADTYVDSDTINIFLSDDNATGPISVTVTSGSGDSEVVTLSSTGGTNYAGSIAASAAAVSANDGTLQVSAADQITVTYNDTDDGEGNAISVTDTASILAGNVALAESNVSGSVTSGSFIDTHSSNDVREAITEERYGGQRTRLEHRWNFSVSGGSSVTFNLEAFHNSSVEDFNFDYSTNGGSSWINMLTVTQNSETSQSVNIGNVSGNIVVRVIDTDRSRRESSQDSIFIDEMYFSSEAPVPGISLQESGAGTSVTEGGSGDSYTIALESVPASTVSVVVTPDAQVDLGNGAGNAVTLTFTPQNALTPQSVNVAAVDDADDEGSHSGLITHAVTSTDPNYNSLSIQDVSVSITDNDSTTGGGKDYAVSESNIDGSVSGSFLDTQSSDDTREVVTEELYGGRKRTRLEHRWSFNVTAASNVSFFLEASHNSSVEDFVFAYSTNGGSSWTNMLTVTQPSDTLQSFNIGSLSGNVLVRVLDTDRSRNENVQDSIFIDEMYFESAAARNIAANPEAGSDRFIRPDIQPLQWRNGVGVTNLPDLHLAIDGRSRGTIVLDRDVVFENASKDEFESRLNTGELLPAFA